MLHGTVIAAPDQHRSRLLIQSPFSGCGSKPSLERLTLQPGIGSRPPPSPCRSSSGRSLEERSQQELGHRAGIPKRDATRSPLSPDDGLAGGRARHDAPFVQLRPHSDSANGGERAATVGHPQADVGSLNGSASKRPDLWPARRAGTSLAAQRSGAHGRRSAQGCGQPAGERQRAAQQASASHAIWRSMAGRLEFREHSRGERRANQQAGSADRSSRSAP